MGPSDNDKDTPDIQDKFGMDGYSVASRDDGGQHHTAFDSDDGGARFSWDTDKDGNYIKDSAHEKRQ